MEKIYSSFFTKRAFLLKRPHSVRSDSRSVYQEECMKIDKCGDFVLSLAFVINSCLDEIRIAGGTYVAHVLYWRVSCVAFENSCTVTYADSAAKLPQTLFTTFEARD